MKVETTPEPERQAYGPLVEIERRLAQQALIAEFGRFALKNHDLDGILTEAARLAADGLDVPLAKVLQKLPDENAFLLRAGVGWKPGIIGRIRIGADLESPAGYAFKTGEPVISNHLAREQRFRTPKVMADHGVQRAVNVIIRGDGEPFGVLEADCPDPGAFNPHDINFLQALANTLGVAIDKERARVEREDLLQQKDLLLREIDHRVKNSLALVASLLGMQERTASSVEAKAVLAAASARLMSIARIHEQLYKSADIAIVEFDSYLAGLCDDLVSSLGRAGKIDFGVDVDRLSLAVDRAVPLGLITVELVTNAIKHARHPSGLSTIRVTCRREDGHFLLTVADDGPGLPEDFDAGATGRLGMRLVRTLVRQLGGSLEAANIDGGARFSVRVSRSGAE
jgi:two-component sensor histidine kinase